MKRAANPVLVLTALVLLFGAQKAMAAPTIAVGTASGQAGTSVDIVVSINPGTDSVSTLNFDITLPPSLTTNTVTASAMVTGAGKSVGSNLIGSTWRFMIFGLNQTPLSNGALLTANVNIAAGASLGGLSMPISNIVFSDPNGNAIPGGTSTGGSVTVVPATPVITSTSAATGQVGVAFTYQITATNSPTSFSATGLAGGLSINTTSGLISGTPTSTGTFNVTLGATNAGGTGTKTLVLTTLPAKPVITSTGTVSGQIGVAFSYQIVATNSPTSFSATGLPTGLSINTTSGLISGTPTATGSFSVTLGATNTGGTGNKTLTLTVLPAAPVITSTGTASGQLGVAFNYQIVATNIPTSYSATGLPGGLSLNTNNGLISGTPTSTGTYSVILGATNTGGTGNKTLSLTILPATPVVTSAGTASGQVNVAFSYQITASNNPTSFNATGLPTGLSVNSTSGLISGTPKSEGSFNVMLSATNTGGTGTKALTLTMLSACDGNIDGSVNSVDVQMSVNQVLGISSCTIDLNLDGRCDSVDVQRVVNAVLLGICVTP